MVSLQYHRLMSIARLLLCLLRLVGLVTPDYCISHLKRVKLCISNSLAYRMIALLLDRSFLHPVLAFEFELSGVNPTDNLRVQCIHRIDGVRRHYKTGIVSIRAAILECERTLLKRT